MITRLFRRNPLDTMLKKLAAENKSRLLIAWNRGLGDIPLGLYAVCHRVRSFIPNASITVLTRPSLAQGFAMLKEVKTLVAPDWVRGEPFSVREALEKHHLSPNMFDIVFDWIDITRWLRWQLGTLVPKLTWKKEWDDLSCRFQLDPKQTYIAAQVQTETKTFYDRSRDWKLSSWSDLFCRITSKKKEKILLFGLEQNPSFLMDGVIDLRGKTSVLEMIALIKNHCRALLAPDSGVVAMVYFLNQTFPLRLVSLWGSPNWGVLRQKVASPNEQLNHIPLIGAHRDIDQIGVDAVYEALACS